MKKKKPWEMIVAIALPIILLLLFVGIQSYMRMTSEDAKFIEKHEIAIKEEIWKELDPEKEHIKSITLQPSTAYGKYENGLGISYQIHFQAFANNDKGYLIEIDIRFPNAEFGPFTLNPPDPYEDEEKYLSDWYIEADRTNAPQWKWKMEEEEREYEAERRQEEARWEKIFEETARQEPHIKEWVKAHETSLKKVIYDILLKEEPELAQRIGEIESVKLKHLFYIEEGDSGCDVILELQFRNFPKEKADFRTYISFDDISFQDLNKGGEISFYSNLYNIDFDYDSKVAKILDRSTGEIIIRAVDNQSFRID